MTQNDVHGERERPSVPAGSPNWITSELIALTIRVWQRYYSAVLTAEDAAAILLSVGRLFDTCARPATRSA